ncbi:hypothetical protein ACFPOI_15100 [Nonomuraea angiospora]|uniref:Uncharacterized protein n=1 Tax=Nonomuraea angiospora TaxID=46172 RepID=A0ABR9MG43_9ACTN|nr:hypothetical protein [Nonomuraea angiospora]MBE1591873.1 hypothetical protein [Nonomuraea angiospora]
MANVKARLRVAVSNVDLGIVLLVAAAVSVLDLLDVLKDGQSDQLILPVLALLAFVWIRDRNRQARVADQLDAVARTTDGMWRLLASGDSVKSLNGAAITRLLEEARAGSDMWLFKGGTGTFIRAVTLPECVERAKRKRSKLRFLLELLDPTDEPLCAEYTQLHRSLADDGAEEKGWTSLGTRKDVYSTILAACWYRQHNSQLLELRIGLSRTISLFRCDLTKHNLVITQRGPEFPGLAIPQNSPHYNPWSIELHNSLDQTKLLDVAKAPQLSARPTVDETRQLFERLGIPLTEEFRDSDVADIARGALNRIDPYEGRVPVAAPSVN